MADAYSSYRMTGDPGTAPAVVIHTVSADGKTAIPAAGGLAVVSNPPAGTGTDGSSSKPALLATVLKAYPVNANRTNLIWQNQSAGPIQIVLYQGDTTSTDFSIILSTGVGANQQGDAGSLVQLGQRHTGAIEVRAASAAQHMSREY